MSAYGAWYGAFEGFNGSIIGDSFYNRLQIALEA